MTAWQTERDHEYYAHQYRQAFKECSVMKFTGEDKSDPNLYRAWDFMRAQAEQWLIAVVGPEEPARVLGTSGDADEAEG